MLFSESIHEQFASSWAMAWLGICQVWRPPAEPDLLGRLFHLGWHAADSRVRGMARWALCSHSFADRAEGGRCSTIPQRDVDEALKAYPAFDYEEMLATLIVAWYRSALPDAEIGRRCRKLEASGRRPGAIEGLQRLLALVRQPKHRSQTPSRRRGKR